MTKEEKQLLLKDLCARLPYSIWGLHRGEDLPLYVIDNSGAYMVLGYNAWFDLDTIPFKPYLRPMSSMTEEEFKMVCSMNALTDTELRDRINFPNMFVKSYTIETFDLFNSHHFDYCGLIPMGLALEAPEDMYKIE